MDQELTHMDLLREKAKKIPRKPGVYIMRDEASEIIYVGKAIDLRNRVRNYLGVGDGRIQIAYLVRRMRDIEVLVTGTEEEAFSLERDLIQRYKPRYNIRLKDDKAFFSVRIDRNDPWPRIELVRKLKPDGALYFGPFTFSSGLRSLLEVIRNVVPLRSCTNTVFFNRTRPCLEYQIKRCAGPCCLPVSSEQYGAWVDQAISLIKGEIDETKRELERDMELASETLRFEEAATLRDRLAVLDNYASGKVATTQSGEGRDVFSIFRDESLAVVCVLIVRGGRIIDTKHFPLSDISVTDDDLFEGVISQFYSDTSREIPEEILVSQLFENAPLVMKMASARKGADVVLYVPEEGSAQRLIQLASMNARQRYETEFEGESRYNDIAVTLATSAKLKQVPRRIEAIDISNLQGSDIVGALVCFIDGAPAKEFYRKYSISFQGVPNDFAAIFEVVTRRLSDSEHDLPDLLLIDGGPQQLEMACKARDELNLSVEIISIAKARTESAFQKEGVEKSEERIFLSSQSEPIKLKDGSPLFRFLTRIRDEVHRFVITFHRQKRSSRVIRSALDEIPGVGPDKRQRLLKAFGSIEAIKKSNPDEVAKAGRMPRRLAEKIIRILLGS